MNGYEGGDLLQNKKKRAVFPIVGKTLSDLFGMVTDDNIESIRKKNWGRQKRIQRS